MDVPLRALSIETAEELLRLRGSAWMIAGAAHLLPPAVFGDGVLPRLLGWLCSIILFAAVNHPRRRVPSRWARWRVAIVTALLVSLCLSHMGAIRLWGVIGPPWPHLPWLAWLWEQAFPEFPLSLYVPLWIRGSPCHSVGNWQPILVVLVGFSFWCLADGWAQGRRASRWCAAILCGSLVAAAAWRICQPHTLRFLSRGGIIAMTFAITESSGLIQDLFVTRTALTGPNASTAALASRSIRRLALFHWTSYVIAAWWGWRGR